jgi:hypothetical protein
MWYLIQKGKSPESCLKGKSHWGTSMLLSAPKTGQHALGKLPVVHLQKQHTWY